MTRDDPPVLFVLAGVNGAGKSSIGGALLRDLGLPWFNPDEAAVRVRAELRCSAGEATVRAWREGKRRIDEAIESRTSHAFETTLGGRTIATLLGRAAGRGFDVLIWYAGLATPELHVARVRARVAAGGHDVPEELILERWNTSRRNLVALLPVVAEVKIFDNSREGNPRRGTIPAPRLVLHWQHGTIVAPSPRRLESTPDWAKPIVARALELQRTAH